MNIPEVKCGIISVSRDCFIISLLVIARHVEEELISTIEALNLTFMIAELGEDILRRIVTDRGADLIFEEYSILVR